MSERKQKLLCPGVEATIIRDHRYKTNRISVVFQLPLEKESAAANAIVPHLLTRACREYPDFTGFNRRLSELYGARVGCSVHKIGEVQSLSVTVAAIQDQYAPAGEALSEACAALLISMIFTPALENGVFRDGDFLQEKRQLAEEIEAEFNDKRVYAKKRCEALMFDGEAYGLGVLGSRESVDALTAEAATAAWKTLLRTAQVKVLLLGKMEDEVICKNFAAAFQKIRAGQPADCNTKTSGKVAHIREFTERFNVAQAKLVMGFRTSVAEPSEQVMAMRLTCALLGGTPHSKLFLNVREKLSLCYYCSSRYDRNKGVLLVESGVEEKNKEAAQKEILNQVEQIRLGNFDEEELRAAKLSVADSFRTMSDSPAYLESWYVLQSFDRRIYTPEEAAEAVRNITAAEVAACAKSLQLDTVYLLAGGAEGSEN